MRSARASGRLIHRPQSLYKQRRESLMQFKVSPRLALIAMALVRVRVLLAGPQFACSLPSL